MITETDLNKLVLIMRRGVGISKEMMASASVMFKELNKIIDLDKPLIKNTKQIREVVNALDVEDELNAKLVEVGSAVVAVHKDLKTIKVTKKMVNDAISVVMPDSNVSTKDMIKGVKGLTVKSAINYTHQAYQQGWTNKKLGEALKTTEAQFSRHVQTIANTAVNAVSNETKRQLYQANDDVIDRVLFLATLDNRTSGICKSLDGAAFKLKDAPSLPLHPNERSQLLPVLKGEDLDEVRRSILPRPAVQTKGKDIYTDKGPKTKNGKARKPGKSANTPLKGTVTDSRNYEEWLRKQPAYYQDDIIGKQAGQAFRNGNKLTDVIKVSPVTEEYLKKAIEPLDPVIKKVVDKTKKKKHNFPRPKGFDNAERQTKDYIEGSFSDKRYFKIMEANGTPRKITDLGHDAYHQNGGINMGKRFDFKDKNNQAIYRHEYGHFLDASLSHHGDNKRFISSSSKFLSAIEKDKKRIEAIDKAYYNKLKAKMKNVDPDNYAVSGRLNSHKRALLQHAEKTKLIDDFVKSKLSVDNWAKKNIKSKFGKTALKNIKSGALYDNLAFDMVMADKANHPGFWANVMQYNSSRFEVRYVAGNGADLVGAITNEKFGGGHGKTYYKKRRYNGVSYGNNTEAFANVFSLDEKGSGEFGQAMADLFSPELTKLIRGLL